MTEIAKRFKRETAEHEMVVLHDDGLYRHLHFRNSTPKHRWAYWFDLITVPGVLIFRGDGESFVFSRLEDMFEFFRGSAWQGQPNTQYWAEKLDSGRGGVMVYQQEMLEAHVKEAVAEAVAATKDGSLAGLENAVQEEVLDEFIGDESLDRQKVEKFEFYANEKDSYAYPKKAPDFQFHETWDVSFRDFDWWFLWACHAIVWGISKYDAHREQAA